MSSYAVLAEALQYPAPGRLEKLQEGCRLLPEGKTRKALGRFVEGAARLSLHQWEELHTRTLDLSPLAAPYVGYQLWGENYRRGSLMADLSAEMRQQGLDLQGELPDHLVPVLRYLERARPPLPELATHLPSAVDAMREALRKAEPDSLYQHLFDAVASAVADLDRGGPA